jgi:hypothetical protein
MQVMVLNSYFPLDRITGFQDGKMNPANLVILSTFRCSFGNNALS